MENFPIIHTNFWDAVIAVPAVVIITELLKLLLPIPHTVVPTIANVIGLIISVFFAHRGNISAGIFMGFFYSNAAVGTYASIRTTVVAYIKRKRQKKKK